MDLDEEQGQYFKGLLNPAKEQSLALFEADAKMDEKIVSLIKSLSIS